MVGRKTSNNNRIEVVNFKRLKKSDFAYYEDDNILNNLNKQPYIVDITGKVYINNKIFDYQAILETFEILMTMSSAAIRTRKKETERKKNKEDGEVLLIELMNAELNRRIIEQKYYFG